ncbi:MAG: glycosyltransferase [bacterium]
MSWQRIAQTIKQTNYALKHKLWPGSRAPKFHYKQLAESETYTGMRILHAGGGRNKHNLFAGQQVWRLNVDLDRGTLGQDAGAHGRVLGDLERLPVQENSIDLIVCEMVFEHVENPECITRELFRCLKEGGKIIFITPNLKSFPFLISKFTPFWFHQLYGFLRARRDEDIFPTHYRLNTTTALRRHFGEAGFELVRLKQIDSSCDYFDIFPVLFLIAAALSQVLNRIEALSFLRQFHIGFFRKPQGPPPPRRYRVAFVSEQYAPDVGSSAQLFAELARELVHKGAGVQVCTLQPGYVKDAPAAPWRELREGVYVMRLPRLPFARTNRKGEALNWLWATIGLIFLALRVPRHVPLLIGTNPPMLHLAGALMKWLRGQRFVALFYDLHPELSCAVGVLQAGSLIDRVWRRMNVWILKQADAAICLGSHMERSVRARYAGAPTAIIHNWCDPELVRSLSKAESRFARAHGLLDKFVILFSGNMGWRQRLEILLEVAAQVQQEPIRFVFIGAGAKKEKLQELVRQKNLQNVLFFPYQPREHMEDSLAAADLSVVSQEREVIGFGVPSKIYTYMASGRALLGLASKPCELIDLIEEARCGWHFDEDHDQDAIAAKLKKLVRRPDRCAEAGRRARAQFEKHFTLPIIAQQYSEILQSQFERGPAPNLFARLCRGRKDPPLLQTSWSQINRELLRHKLVAPPEVHHEPPQREFSQCIKDS